MNQKLNIQLASLSTRLGAFLIDVVILMLIELIVVFLLMELKIIDSEKIQKLNDIGRMRIGELIAVTLYFPILTAIFKASPGKKILHLKVVSTNGENLHFAKILFRESIGRAMGTLLLGGLWSLIDKDKRNAWDFAVGSIVVKDNSRTK
jgi:uncharacterized RDD family membrane protein YckC